MNIYGLYILVISGPFTLDPWIPKFWAGTPYHREDIHVCVKPEKKLKPGFQMLVTMSVKCEYLVPAFFPVFLYTCIY